jgi:general secretion pathway protein C
LAIFSTLAVFIFITLIHNLWQWYGDWHLAQPISNTQTHAKNDTVIHATTIPDQHLFGQSLTSDVPVTSLQFRVTGIVKVDNEHGRSVSKAYISETGQPSKIYQVGDSLPYGVKVYAINSDAVILQNDGAIEKLPLPREQLQFKPRDDVEQQ